jgi:hypothetical protein
MWLLYVLVSLVAVRIIISIIIDIIDGCGWYLGNGYMNDKLISKEEVKRIREIENLSIVSYNYKVKHSRDNIVMRQEFINYLYLYVRSGRYYEDKFGVILVGYIDMNYFNEG